MGLRFRKSVSLGKGLRLNFGKKGMSVSAGVRGAHVTYSTTGRKTTSVGIPGTGISYVKSEKMGGKKSGSNDLPPVPPEGNNNLLGSNPPPKKKHGCGLFAGIFAIIIIIAAAVNSCSGGGASSSESSSANSAVVSSNVSSEETSSEVVSSKTAPSKEASSKIASSKAPPSTAPKAATSSKLTLVDAPGTVTNGSNASLTIKGKPNTQYSIAVYYSAGKSSAQGLESKASGSDGSVSWTWKVGAKTKAGTHRIVISGGGDQIETSITTEK